MCPTGYQHNSFVATHALEHEKYTTLCSGNRRTRNKIVLADENKNISEEHLVSEGLNNLFKNATQSLHINENPYIIDEPSK